MNKLFTREVYIRLTDEETGFVCTVKHGKFYAKATEFALHSQPTPEALDETVLVLARKRSSGLATVPKQL